MPHYNKRNKFKTAWQIIEKIQNWPTAFGLRLRQKHEGLRLLNFRDGLNIACRGGTRDWEVVHELCFAGGYNRALGFLKSVPGEPIVLDLGGNIGLFSLLAALTHPLAQIHAYEPGPPNYQMFELNSLANSGISERIHLCKEAVGGRTRVAEWHFDKENPGASSFFGLGGIKYQVQIRAFAEVLNSFTSDIALAKIDIEGTEYEILQSTPPESWTHVQAIALELHDNPEGSFSREDFIKQMGILGFKVEEETVVSLFLHR
jgi:FkbM family methyltransferase